MAGYHVIETPAVREKYQQASAELLTMLGYVVYPALREDPTNETGRYPIQYRHDGWYTFEIETPGAGLHYLTYQAIEDMFRVMVFDLVTFREP